jgi:hypothetical protein
MINIILAKAFSVGIVSSILMNLFTDLLPGVVSGIIAGLVVGAIIIPLMQEPDALGRALLFGAILGLLMLGYQLVQIISITGGSMGSILNALDRPVTGQAILNGLIYVLYALLAGCLIGVFMTVPGEAIKGGLIGMLFGVIIGTAMYWLLGYLGIYMDTRLFQLLIGLLIFGVLTAVTGKT